MLSMNANLIPFPGKGKPQAAIASRLKIDLPMYDSNQPLVITITGAAAANIRRDALRFGKRPDEYAVTWLMSYVGAYPR